MSDTLALGTFRIVSEIDTIPPVILQDAQNKTVICNSTTLDSLQRWYELAGGAEAMDDSGEFSFLATVSPAELVDSFLYSSQSLCGRTGLITIGFFAVDTCGNSSLDTSYASFNSIDEIKPKITKPALSVLGVNCQENIDSLLNKWIDQRGGAQASDNCSNSLLWDSFIWQDNAGNSGMGIIDGGPYIPVDNSVCNWSVNVSFIVEDLCGNVQATTASFTTIDTLGLQFMSLLPPDLTVSCDSIPEVPDILASDLCQGTLNARMTEITTKGSDSSACEFVNYTIKRTFTATAACGETIEHIQNISVIDTTAPGFIAPLDLSVSCLVGVDTSITGIPFIQFDNCPNNLVLSFQDEITIGGCVDTLVRSWKLEDACGNSKTIAQLITIVDDSPPDMDQSARDTSVYCDLGTDIAARFQNWLGVRANATATDACNSIDWYAAEPGSYNVNNINSILNNPPKGLKNVSCQQSPGIIKRGKVDFVAIDICGNATVTTASFELLDTTPPEIIEIPESFAFMTSGLDCGGLVTLPVPLAIDNCTSNTSPLVKNITKEIYSSSPGSESIPVESIELQFGPYFLQNSLANGIVSLSLDFENLDADDPSEYFDIYTENGELLTRTNLSLAECSGSSIIITDLTPQNINNWAQDGFIYFYLIPNTPGDGTLAINDICSNSKVHSQLSFEVNLLESLGLEISINDSQFLSIPFTSRVDTFLSVGSYDIEFRFSDCAQNSTAASYQLQVRDENPPSIFCPDDITVFLEEGECEKMVSLATVNKIEDACGSQDIYSERIPKTNSLARVNFVHNTSVDDFVAVNKQFVFLGVSSNAFSTDPLLTLEYKGDMDELGEYYKIFGENGYLLGTNEIGQNHVQSGSCNQFGKAAFSIPREIFNTWAQDGFIEITAVSNQQGNNLINPCDPFQVQSDGDSDLITTLFARLEYEKHSPSFSVSGATQIPNTVFPAPGFIPEVILNQGINTIIYKTIDESGNPAECSFKINVIDSELPELSCQNIFLNVHPSGLISIDLETTNLITQLSDNCTVESIQYDPAVVTCEDAGTEVGLLITVSDQSGNTSVCQTSARVEVLDLQPQFSAAICGSGILQLFANAPDSPDPEAYTFSWTGPNNFSSNEEDPVILNAGAEFSGVYMLEITGFNSCQSSGSVDVFIEELSTPALNSNQLEYCQDDLVVLNATLFTGEVSYKWYEGIFPNGILIETTLSPTFAMRPPLGEHLYYVVVESENCISNASASYLIEIIKPPLVSVGDAFVTVCEGDPIMLTAENVNTELDYKWFGPNGFFSTSATTFVSQAAKLSNQGIYKLVIADGECNSDTASVQVVVFDKPDRPTILANDIVCAGGTIMLSVSNITDGDKYTWYLNGTLFSSQSNNTLIINNSQASHSGFWQVFVAEGFCKSELSASIQISVETQLQIGATNDGPVCKGDSIQLAVTSIPNAQYHWTGPDGFESLEQNPKVLAASGSYDVIITTEAGCSSSANTLVETRTPPVITALSNSSAPCMNGTSSVVLVPTIFPTGNYLYQWSGPNGFSSSNPMPVISNFTSEGNGLYLLAVSDGMCASEPASTTIHISDIPKRPVIEAIRGLCEGDTLIIQVINAGPGVELFHWETPKGSFTLSSGTLIVPNVSPSDLGLYAVSSSVNGCSSLLSEPLNIIINPTPIPPAPHSNSPICEGETLELTAPFISGVKYQWVGPGSFSSQVRNPEIFEAGQINEGAYIMRILKNGCPSPWSEAIFVNVRETPPLPVIDQEDLVYCRSDLPSSITICLDATSTISGSIYDWEILNVDLLIQRTSARCISFNDFNKLETGENLITVFADRNGCSAPLSDPLIIELSEIPIMDADAGQDKIICGENSVIIEANNPGGLTGFWRSPDTDIIIGQSQSAVTGLEGLQTGENIIIWTLSDPICGDYSSDSLTIIVESTPVAVNDQYIINYNQEIIFSPLDNDVIPSNYTVGIVDSPKGGELVLNGEEFQYVPRSSFIGEDRIVYELCNSNCADFCSEAEIRIKIGETNDCFLSTVITPNQDGINDKLIIPCIESGNYPNNKLIVFNIWGDEVFSAEPYLNNWEGDYDGETLSSGTYYFILDLQDGNPAIHGFLVIEQ